VAASVQTELDLEALDATVEGAIERGDPARLPIVGFGEISLVLGWPPDRPVLAVKRLPVFQDVEAAERYQALVAAYIAALHERGIAVVDTVVRAVAVPGAVHVYLVQPLVPRERVLTMMLASEPHERAGVLVERLVDAICAGVDERLGLDAQAGNWAVEHDRLALFDVSTPLIRSADGRDLLDMAVFASVYPAALRPALRRIAHAIAAQYHDPRGVLLDVASNLHKERLDRCVPLLLAAAGSRAGPPVTHREVLRYFHRDRALWLLLQRLRRLDRAWQRAIRGRPYPILLPPPYRYGPMTPPGEVPS
jgi:Family of unknown function (DUF6206)